MTANDEQILTSVKINLGIVHSQMYDGELSDKIDSAKSRIRKWGIALEETTDHNQLVAMYAVWLWNSRKSGEKMPQMLRDSLNDELFHQKGNAR